MTAPTRTGARPGAEWPSWTMGAVPVERGARDLQAGDAMSWGPVTVSPDTTASFASSLAVHRGINHLPVRAGDQIVGILCTCDLRDASPRTIVAERMRTPVVLCGHDEPIERAADRMLEHDIGCLPVLEGPALRGILTRGDLRRIGFFRGDRACATCGSRHHVRGRFCLECLDAVRHVPLSEHWIDIGGGD